MPKSWIYKLPKIQLAAELEIHGLDTDGSIDELRHRLSAYVTDHPDVGPQSAAGGNQTQATPTITLQLPDTNPARTVTSDPPTPGDVFFAAQGDRLSEAPAKVMNQVRKWGCHFDGKDPVAFLERLEELKDAYQYSGAQLLMGLPELFKGDALLWCRNNRPNWREWGDFCADFREYYLPRRYRAKLVREIQTRLQKTDEPYRKFATEMLTMMRRATGFAEEDQVEALYSNMHPRYQLYIRRDTVSRTRDLLRWAEEYEYIEEQTRARQAAEPKPAIAATAYDRRECCWRCKQRGHTRFDCRRPPRRFCSQCGRDGVFTKDCHPPPGNAARTGEEAAAPRSSE